MSLAFSSAASLKRKALAVGLIGCVLTAIGLLIDRQNFFAAYLQAYMFVIAFPLGCLMLLMVHCLSGGRWGWTIRPFLEAGIRTLPLVALFFIPILFGLKTLYPWTDTEFMHHDPALHIKSAYLNTPFWLARAAFYFASWLLIGFTMLRVVPSSPEAAARGEGRNASRFAAVGLMIYVLTMSFAAIDWVMSLEPHWFSSIFGVLVLVGHGNSAFGICMLAAVWTHQRQANPWMTEKNLHDLGKFLFMTILLWGYISLSQFLIIYSGNLPEETYWYWQRGQGQWQVFSTIFVVIQFVIPFFVLLAASRKRNPRVLMIIIPILFGVRLLEQIWLVSPGMRLNSFPVHWLDLVSALGLGGVWFAAYAYFLSGSSGVPSSAGALGGPHDKPIHGGV